MNNGDNIQTGNIVGNGIIVGKQIHIEGDFIVEISEKAESYGLNLLPPRYFVEHKATELDLEDWRKGFSFKLESIKDRQEYRRSSLLNSIENKLEQQHSLLLLGQTGTSKSTVLMEIVCDYFEKGYQILYNFGDKPEITNGSKIRDFIEKLLNDGNKLLLAIDNVHDERTATIFYVMDLISNHILSGNIRFILTASIPEFDWFIKERLIKVEEEVQKSIIKLTDQDTFRYELPYFNEDEINDFITKYVKIFPDINSESIEQLAKWIFVNTNGNPLMVKFFVVGQGLDKDVKIRFNRHLYDPMRMHTMLVCSLLDIANIQITDDMLENMNILEYAYYLENITLRQLADGLWKTIHPRWDIELLSLIYNESDKRILSRNKGYLKKAIDSIFNIDNERITVSVIQIMYDLSTINIDGVKNIPINIIEDTVGFQIPKHLSEQTKSYLYALVIAYNYAQINRYNDALVKCIEATEIDPTSAYTWYNRAYILYKLGNLEDAVKYYTKTIDLDPNHIKAWNNKGLTYHELANYDEAIKCYDKAIEIKSDYYEAWYNKGLTYHELANYDEAIKCYDKAIEIKSHYEIFKDPDSLYNRSCSKIKKGQIHEGLNDLEEAIKIGGEIYITAAKEEKDFVSILNNERYKALFISSI
jgi:tetratricopeptide (TPR) repeat protein